MLMNIFLNTIGLQTTSPAMFIVILVAVGLIILIAVVVSSTDERKENEQKEKWIKSNSHKLKIQDDFLSKFISPLSKLTPKCNKCNNDVYNIWGISSYELELRCSDCKKIYKIDIGEHSKIAIDSLEEYIDFVVESINNSNEKIRKYLIDKLIFDFSNLRSNQPLIKALRFQTSSEEVAISTRLNFKLVGYNVYHSFNENEYFEEDNILLDDLNNYLKDIETINAVNIAFKENPKAD